EPGDGRGRRRHLLVRPARFAQRLPRRLGGDPRPPARQSLPPLQLRRADAAPAGAPENQIRNPFTAKDAKDTQRARWLRNPLRTSRILSDLCGEDLII